MEVAGIDIGLNRIAKPVRVKVAGRGNVRGGEYTFTIAGQVATLMCGVGMWAAANNR